MNRQRAAVVGALGIKYFKAGRFETAAEHKPEYLRVSQAERERAEREKKAVTEVREMSMEDGAAVAEMEHQLFTDAWSEKSVLETLGQGKHDLPDSAESRKECRVSSRLYLRRMKRRSQGSL